VLDEAEGGQVADLAGVQFGLEGEVEGVQALVVGQARELEGVAEPPASRTPTSSSRSRSMNSR
jgi:hypothetical protein